MCLRGVNAPIGHLKIKLLFGFYESYSDGLRVIFYISG